MIDMLSKWEYLVLHLQVGSSLLNDLASSPNAIKDIDDFHSTVNDL